MPVIRGMPSSFNSAAPGGMMSAGAVGGLRQARPATMYPGEDQTGVGAGNFATGEGFHVSVNPGGLPPVSAQPGGGYARVSIPNPNAGKANLQRNNVGLNPNAASSGQQLQLAGMANRQASDYAESTRQRDLGDPGMLNGVLPDMRWEGLKQALFQAGANHLASGAATFGDQPGHFDTQNNSALEQLQRLEYLKASDLNYYNGRLPSNYQDPTKLQSGQSGQSGRGAGAYTAPPSNYQGPAKGR